MAVALWWAAATAAPEPLPAALLAISRLAVLAAPLLALLWALLCLAAAIAAGGARRRRAVALAALLAVALALRLTGLGHELVDRPYLDEGTYYHHAVEINRGHVFRPTFVYPHLVYYADAVLLWGAELWRGPLSALLEPRLAADAGWLEVQWLLLRLLPALLGTLVVLPVFRAAETLAAAVPDQVAGTGSGTVSGAADQVAGTRAGQVAGTRPVEAAGQVGGTWTGPLLAGVLAALAMAGAPLWNEISHLNISDLPAAYFAAVCLAASAGLLRRESNRGYLVAGLAGGLAAVSKYPAGVVVVAVAAVWLRHRLATRRWGWGLSWAALAAMGAFVVLMPSLLVFPHQALFGDRGIFFGVRQYAGGGWIGVQPDSFVHYYAGLVRGELGLPLLLAALAGVAFLTRGERRRLAWMLPFPLAYLALMLSMSMVVQRNLLPAVPALAVVAGVAAAAALRKGLAVALRRLPERWPRRRLTAALAVVLVVALVLPAAFRSAGASRALAAPSTRELARAWIAEHVPPGSALLVESYGPRLSPARYAVWGPRFAARVPLADARAAGVGVIVLASAAYARFLDPAQHSRPHHAAYAAWYRHAFAELPRLAEIAPEGRRWGPVIHILRLPPPPPSRRPRRLSAAELFVPDAGMALRAGGETAGRRGAESADVERVFFFVRGQWCAARLDLAAGRYRLRLHGGGPAAGRWRLVDADGRPRGEGEVVDGAAELAMTAPGRALLYLHLEQGAWLEAVSVEPWSPPPVR